MKFVYAAYLYDVYEKNVDEQEGDLAVRLKNKDLKARFIVASLVIYS
ncbi:hypothetical protein [Candidatus Hydrogenosomobacter endosymbioticus]|nr:hypothetical protein [Candidatus Hydrogenosomobacter endosymbioticus]